MKTTSTIPGHTSTIVNRTATQTVKVAVEISEFTHTECRTNSYYATVIGIQCCLVEMRPTKTAIECLIFDDLDGLQLVLLDQELSDRIPSVIEQIDRSRRVATIQPLHLSVPICYCPKP